MAKTAKKIPFKHSDEQATIEFVEQLKNSWLETIDAIPDPFIVVQDDYTILKANQTMADISNSKVKQIVGQKCYEIFAGRHSPCENCQMHSSKAGQSMPGYEIYNHKNDRWYEVATRRLVNQAEQKGVVQIYRDRTDAKKFQHQLAQNEKLASIGQLAGGFAHEINNPLGGILVFAQMLLRELPQNSAHYQDVVEIESAAQRCKSIVESLLDYSRQRPLRPKFANCDINLIIKNAVKFATLGEQNQNRRNIELHLNAQSHIIYSDYNRLTQVFLNLCLNAIQATHDDSPIEIHTANTENAKSRYIIAKIIDQGVGIEEKNLSKIFEPFFTTKEPGQGTGLGLSIVHGIMQDIGGSIDVKSRKGHGTTVTLKIPITSLPRSEEST